MIDLSQVKTESVGRWPRIMAGLGVNVGDGKHKDCPVCGGKDRFRFDDKDGRGTWICNQCGAGDGIKLVEKVFNVDFTDAVKRVADVVGNAEPVRKTDRKQSQSSIRRLLNDIWARSIPLAGSDPVSHYLRGRRLLMAVNDVRYCPKCWESDTGTEMPTMVALVRNPAGKPVCIHRTYLDGAKKAAIKSPKKLTPRIEPLVGCAIRLFKTEDYVGVAEGIETAMAATQLTGIPTWAAVNCTLLESFEPPDSIRKITVFGDSDANYVGQTAAYKLAKKLHLKGYIVDVQLPIHGDWADQIRVP